MVTHPIALGIAVMLALVLLIAPEERIAKQKGWNILFMIAIIGFLVAIAFWS